MLKENHNPNYYRDLPSKAHSRSFNQKPLRPTTATPQSTSRQPYRPKFIKKHAKLPQDSKKSSYPVSVDELGGPSISYINSPISFTENNTIEIDTMQGNRARWKDMYLKTQQELNNRTEKFNESIDIFEGVLVGMRRTLQDKCLNSSQRIKAAQSQIESLLAAFGQFRIQEGAQVEEESLEEDPPHFYHM